MVQPPLKNPTMPRASSLTAVVAAKSAEDRTLLRALLRLHHVVIDGEADGAALALRAVRDRRPSHLVVDSELADGTVASLVTEARALVPELRVVLLVRATTPVDEAHGSTLEAIVRLTRPFRFLQFAEALGLAP